MSALSHAGVFAYALQFIVCLLGLEAQYSISGGFANGLH